MSRLLLEVLYELSATLTIYCIFGPDVLQRLD